MMMLHFTSLALAVAVGSAPNNAAQPSLRAAADSDAVLTVDAINRMATFWSNFMKEPDSIKTDARKATQEQVTLQQGAVQAVNMTAMAAKYPSVAADLQKAGLTVKQWSDYRIALYSASLSKESGGTPEATSVLGKNVAFLGAHDKEFNALKGTGMWIPKPQAQGGMGNGMGGMGGGDDDLNP